MLTKKTLAIAEALAVDTQVEVDAVVSPVVRALNDTLAGVLPLTPESYMQRVPELSATSPEYGMLVDEVSNAMAENLRGTFDQIRVYGRGLSRAIAEAINNSDVYLSSVDRLAKNFLLRSMDLEFIRTDHPFYSSLFYPVRAPATTLSFTEISTDSLSKVKFARWESSQIINWLGIDNPEINQLMMSSNVDLCSALCALGHAMSLPFEYCEQTDTMDFTKPFMNQAETLFVQYILLCKMVAEDAPFEGLTSGGLEDYRNHVRLLHTAYAHALINLKVRTTALTAFPVRIVEGDGTVVREAQVVEGSKNFACVRAKATIYFNAAGLDLCIQNGLNFSDIAIAYFYCKYVTLEPSTAQSYTSDLRGAASYVAALSSKVVDIATGATGQVYNKVINNAMLAFVNSRPELVEQYDKAGTVGGVQALVNGLLGETDWGRRLAHAMSEERLSTEDALFSIHLPMVFLQAIGCKDACAILHATMHAGHANDCEVTKRENLHYAVIEHFVNKLMTAV